MAILNRSIRNMVLAGIGAAALAHEESSDLLHHLVEKVRQLSQTVGSKMSCFIMIRMT